MRRRVTNRDGALGPQTSGVRRHVSLDAIRTLRFGVQMQVGSNDVSDQRDEEHCGAVGEMDAQDPEVRDPAIEEPDASLAEVMEALEGVADLAAGIAGMAASLKPENRPA